MNRILVMFISSLCLPGVGGCVTHQVGHFSVVATRHVNLSAESERVATDVVGKNVHWFVFIDPTFSFPSLDAAIDDAIDRSGGDFITDVRVALKFFFVPGFYYRIWFEVQGNVWKTKTVSPTE